VSGRQNSARLKVGYGICSPASILMPVVDNFHANTYAELGS